MCGEEIRGIGSLKCQKSSITVDCLWSGVMFEYLCLLTIHARMKSRARALLGGGSYQVMRVWN